MGIDTTEYANRYGGSARSVKIPGQFVSISLPQEEIERVFGGMEQNLKKAIRPTAAAAAYVLREKVKDNVDSMLKPWKGLLQNSIYMKWGEEYATDTYQQYSVSYNSAPASRGGKGEGSEVAYAPHGHLLEQGHQYPYLVKFDRKKQRWFTVVKPDKLKDFLALPLDKWGRRGVPRGQQDTYFIRVASPMVFAPRPFVRNAVDALPQAVDFAMKVFEERMTSPKEDVNDVA